MFVTEVFRRNPVFFFKGSVKTGIVPKSEHLKDFRNTVIT